MKSRLTVTIDKDILKNIKLLAVKKEITLSKITEIAFIDYLSKEVDNKKWFPIRGKLKGDVLSR